VKSISQDEVEIFSFQEENVSSKIRILIDENNNVWFVAKDIFEVLGIPSKGGQSDAIADLDEDEKSSFKTNPRNSNDTRLKEFNIVSESGLYSLIMRSRKPVAKPFQKWVTKEVLPTIRKTGSYSVEKKEEIEITDFQQMTIDSMNYFQLYDVLKSRSTFELFLMEKTFHEKSPTKVFGMDFSEKYFLPSELGTLKGMTGAEMNLEFEKKGFQTRNENEKWELTEKGKKFAIQLGGKFSQIKWKLETILK
jgi:prophage antirepressor-like protein